MEALILQIPEFLTSDSSSIHPPENGAGPLSVLHLMSHSESYPLLFSISAPCLFASQIVIISLGILLIISLLMYLLPHAHCAAQCLAQNRLSYVNE